MFRVRHTGMYRYSTVLNELSRITCLAGAGYNLVDNGEPGVAVKALYDYEAAEPDELTFKTGNNYIKNRSSFYQNTKTGHHFSKTLKQK